jgi:hypothetical protein
MSQFRTCQAAIATIAGACRSERTVLVTNDPFRHPGQLARPRTAVLRVVAANRIRTKVENGGTKGGQILITAKLASAESP